MLVKPARGGWRDKGKQIAHKMQQGRQLEDVKRDSIAREAGRAFSNIAFKKNENAQKDMLKQNKDTIQLTPEEQEVVKKIEGKSAKSGFSVNIRLVASALTQERSEVILSELENAFIQYENPGLNSFKVSRENKLRSKNIAFDFIFRNFRSDQSFA